MEHLQKQNGTKM